MRTLKNRPPYETCMSVSLLNNGGLGEHGLHDNESDKD